MSEKGLEGWSQSRLYQNVKKNCIIFRKQVLNKRIELHHPIEKDDQKPTEK